MGGEAATMKAIFHKQIGIVIGNMSWVIEASPEPQTLPRAVIEAAVARGAATIVPPQRTQPDSRQPGDEPT
jgi:hypothetical protein